MERTDDYLRRKNAELAWLNGKLVRPVPLDPATNVQGVVTRKLAFRARLLAQAILRDPWLTETNAKVGEVRDLGAFTADYRYQRFDLRVGGPALTPQPDLPVVRSIRYTSSGMGAITAVLVALGRAPNPPTVVSRQECYFETRQVLSELAGLRWEAFGEHEDLARAARGRVALWIDSITVGDDLEVLDALDPGAMELIAVDTTCWPLTSDRHARAEAAAVRLGVPLVAVRSHVKLDFLGVEYGRLGSAAFTVPIGVPGPTFERLRALQEVAGHFVGLVGAAPVPYHLTPLLADPELQALNAVRIAQMMENNAEAAARIAPRLPYEVGTFHHGLFFTVAVIPPGDAPPERLEAAIRSLLAACGDLPVRFANSFGFDFVGLAPFHLRGYGCVRIAMGDVPEEVVVAVADRVVAWLRPQN